TERSILLAHADDVVTASEADTLVELGSGTSEKTRILLDAFHGRGRLRTFVPFDVSEATLRGAAASVASEYPGVGVHAVVVDFEAGEEMRTEISAKFRRDKVAHELDAAGFELAEWWSDPAGDFALSLARRVQNA